MQLIKPKTCLDWFKIYQLYKKAFPISERKPFALIFNTFHKEHTDVWYIQEDNEFIGLAITMNDQDIVLLDYFAITQSKRNQGYGTKALKQLNDIYNNHRLFIEIETTLESSDNQHERLKRKQFYLRNGMKELHIQANVFGVNMELLGFKENITFEDYYNTYIHIYGKQSADHLIELSSK